MVGAAHTKVRVMVVTLVITLTALVAVVAVVVVFLLTQREVLAALAGTGYLAQRVG